MQDRSASVISVFMPRPFIAILLVLSFTTIFPGVSVNAEKCGLVPPKGTVRESDGNGSSGTGPSHTNNPGTGAGGYPGNNTTSDDVVVTGWYPGWQAGQAPPPNLTWEKFTHLTYAFAVTGSIPSNIVLNSDDQQVLPVFVQAAHSHGVQALVSIGGWTGSRFFSTAVATPANRTTFAQAVVQLANTYDLDGIDFDWEYPNKQGIGCNAISPDDAANFLLFLQELRQDPVGQKLYLTAAVGIKPFNGPDGSPSNDVSGFSKVLNHIAIMSYDISGPWSTGIGPNAPLDDSCAPTQVGSAKSAVQAWTGAGFPASQIVLGVPAYGHSFHVADQGSALDTSGNIKLYSPFTPNSNALVPASDGGVDVCGNPASGGTDTYDFSQMITAGFLSRDGTAASGVTYTFDNCSQTVTSSILSTFSRPCSILL